MIEGLWVVQYEGIQGGGGTVLVLVNGQVLGGDNGFTIIGEYQIAGTTLSAKVKVHNYLKSVPSIFDFAHDYELQVHGTIEVNTIRAKAEIIDKNMSGLVLKMTKAEDLRHA